MGLHVDLQIDGSFDDVPATTKIECWALAAIGDRKSDAQLSVCVVDRAASQALNARYREQDKPTNVLSFPADLPEALNLPLLGDLVACAPVITSEAAQQGKSIEAHWAHMIVHGTLHLLGYDHIKDDEAVIMEQLETDILVALGYPPPYANDAAV